MGSSVASVASRRWCKHDLVVKVRYVSEYAFGHTVSTVR